MIDVALEFCVEWMTDPAAGLNAELPGVPRRAGDAVPPDVAIFNALDHDWVSRGTIPPDKLVDGPALIIAPSASLEHPIPFHLLPDRQQTTEPDVPIQFIVALKRNQHARYRRVAGYALRAVARVLAKRFPAANTVFVRDQVVVRLGRTAPGLFSQPIDPADDLFVGALVVPFACLDRWALGITN